MSRGQPSAAQLVDIHDAVAMAARLIEPTARARGITVRSGTTAPAELRVRADDSELQHALINLLLNAIQACPAGGLVRIDVSEGGPQAHPHGAGKRARHDGGKTATIAVSDNGCGIAPEDQARIFEPFFSARPGGTGLGLFLTLNFVRRWGGDILVDSAPGQGSTFTIVLPGLGTAAARAGAPEALPA
jgi:two-component system sensor histidine kinase FlrB